jgi:hypothetical protein
MTWSGSIENLARVLLKVALVHCVRSDQGYSMDKTAVNNSHAAEEGVTELMSGIAKDAQDLATLQLALLRQEIRESTRAVTRALVFLAVGAAIGLAGVLLLCHMLVQLLAWALPSLPLWSCYCFVGLVLATVATGFVYMGISRFRSAQLLPRQSAEALKEDFRWFKNRK